MSDEISKLGVVHLAMVTGLVMLSFIFVFMKPLSEIVWSHRFSAVEWLILAGMGMLLIMAKGIYSRRLSAIRSRPNEEKWPAYKILQILTFAMLEAAVLLGLLVFYMNENGYVLVIAIGIIVILALSGPSKARFEAETDGFAGL